MTIKETARKGKLRRAIRKINKKIYARMLELKADAVYMTALDAEIQDALKIMTLQEYIASAPARAKAEVLNGQP